MAARDIAYVELYAKDRQQTAHSFVSLGFTCVADSVAPDCSSLLLRQGAAHLVITSGPATWKFLDTHGEGVADIALLCADVTATAQRAVRAGAGLTGSIRGNPILSGAGGLTHALLPATRTANLLPAGHRWVELPQDLGPSAEGNWRLAHVRFAKTSPILADLAGGHADRTWQQRIRELVRPDVLILDDFAMRQLSAAQADDLYELVSERQGRSLIITSNRAPSDWYPLFPNPVVAESLLDRLINTSHQAIMNGPSYRPNKHPKNTTDKPVKTTVK
ncbi:ATP-binding protein [Streptomyces shenzhenensis]|uniref:ATP-binding protein n=1 Tax=Streptomyces shenzhenensis TaxID=943815 RepID=UPI0027E45D89|nr:ATP-binding protein [Streptomyces shenzhenensis]